MGGKSTRVSAEIVEMKAYIAFLKAKLKELETKINSHLILEEENKPIELYEEYFKLSCEYIEAKNQIERLKIIW